MANPTVTASLDKATYNVGDNMILTVVYGDADTQSITVTVQVTDKSGNQSNPQNVSAVIDPLTVAVTDDSGRTWTRQSDNGTTAVYKAVA